MRIVYASRTGNTESLVEKCGYSDPLKIETGEEEITEDYVLFTYTDGAGDVPAEVQSFLDKNDDSYIKGVVCTGDTSFGDVFCGAGDTIAEDKSVPLIAKVEQDGTDEDVEKIKEEIGKL